MMHSRILPVVLFFLLGCVSLSAQIAGQKPELILYFSNGSPTGAQPAMQGDTTGRIKFNALTATGNIKTGASILSWVEGPVSPGFLQSNLVFRTGFLQSNRMIITSSGLVGIGTLNPQYHLDIVGNTHTSGDYFGRWHIDNNSTTDDAPNTYLTEAYFERKQRSILGVPAGAGNDFGATLTIAPDPNATTFDHQLFFGDDGIYNRFKTGNAADWSGAAWNKLLSGADINGTTNFVSKFTGPNSLGNSQLFDNGANVGIGVGNAPDAAFRLTVGGATRVNGGLTVGNDANVGGNAVVAGNANISGNSNVTGDNNVGGNENVSGDANIDGDIDVDGGGRIDGTLVLGASVPNPPHAGALVHQLYIGGSMICTEAKVALIPAWPDYVFEEDYQLMPLAEKEQFVKENRHLPGVPTAQEVAETGLPLGQTQLAVTQNLEEVYLHLFEMEKRLNALEAANKRLEAENTVLKAQIEKH
ncbi:MAG: hypothetical protein IT259_17135 [Saprospiraceae bacterium]|nr:hypothetical protein [Saprospiraceae bacterium]